MAVASAPTAVFSAPKSLTCPESFPTVGDRQREVTIGLTMVSGALHYGRTGSRTSRAFSWRGSEH